MLCSRLQLVPIDSSQCHWGSSQVLTALVGPVRSSGVQWGPVTLWQCKLLSMKICVSCGVTLLMGALRHTLPVLCLAQQQKVPDRQGEVCSACTQRPSLKNVWQPRQALGAGRAHLSLSVWKEIMSFLVATNVIASRPPEYRPTETSHTWANFLMELFSLPQDVYKEKCGQITSKCRKGQFLFSKGGMYWDQLTLKFIAGWVQTLNGKFNYFF